MAFGSVTLQPGVNVERTPMVLRAGFSASSLIRFRDSLVQKLGGWLKYYPFAISGVPRDLHAWQDLNEVDHLAVLTTGTGTKLAVITNNIATDITPQTLISNFTPDFSTVINTPIVTIVDPNAANVTVDDSVFFNTPISGGGLILFGLFPIIEIVGVDSYEISVTDAVGNPINATATVSHGGVVPTFTTISTSTSVTVDFPAHGLSPGSTFVFQIPTMGNGVTINGAYVVNAVPDANHFTITANTQATASSTFPMNGGDAQLVYSIALGPSPAGSGFGLGGFGLGGFGTGAIGGALTGTEIVADDWTSDNWGEILIACPENGGIYFWDPTSGFNNAQIIPGAPAFNRGIFISSQAQILIAYGASVARDIGIQQQALLVAWSTDGDFTNWVPLATDQAGNFTLSNGSAIIAGASVSNQNLLWTDLDLWSMNYIGAPLVYGFNKIGAGMGAVSSHAIQNLRGSVFWMAPTNFCAYTSSGANVIPCPVWDAVFQNLNTAFAHNVRAMPNTPYNEVGWLFPSINSTSGENDSFVKMNITENGAPWDYCIGGLSRSAWIDESVVGMPIGASPQGVVYEHEVSPDADGNPLVSSFTTGFFYLAESEEYVFVDQIIPDFKWNIFPGGASAQIQMTFNVVNYPGDTPMVFGPYTVTQATEAISVRFRGRLMSIGVESSDIGSFWRIGSCKYRYAPAGRR